MNEYGFGSYGGALKRKLHRNCDDKIEYFLSREEQILRCIAGRAPVHTILNEICCALDCQIGNIVSMVSLISLSENGETEEAEIAWNAARCGLHAFFSAGIFADGGEAIATLEMYCCTAREPSASELRIIERAACLAGVAIECETVDAQTTCRTPGIEQTC